MRREHLDFGSMEYILISIGLFLALVFTLKFISLLITGKKVNIGKWINNVLDSLWGMG